MSCLDGSWPAFWLWACWMPVGVWRGGVAAAGAEALMATRLSDRIAGEQEALRRVAMLVAGGAPPEEVFAAVTGEAGRLLGAHLAMMFRYEPDGAITVVASWSSTGTAFPLGTRWSLGGRNLPTPVSQTGRAARIDDITGGSGLAGLRDRVEALGGRLSLHSPPGEGTTLQVQLPIGQARPPAAGAVGPGAAHSAHAMPPWSRSDHIA
jgi:hypothetical protein